MHCILSIHSGDCYRQCQYGLSLCIAGDQQIMYFPTTFNEIRNVMFVNVVYKLQAKKFCCFSGLTKFADHTHSLFGVQVTHSCIHREARFFLTETMPYDGMIRGMVSGLNVKYSNIR